MDPAHERLPMPILRPLPHRPHTRSNQSVNPVIRVPEIPMSIIDQIKEATDLAQLIGQSFTLTGRDHARTRSTVEHDSLIIWTDTHTWYWFSQTTGGDCLDWYQHIHRCTLTDAIDALAHAANIERRPPTPAAQ